MKPREPSLFILLMLISFASVSAVLFTPALPQISEAFGISSEQVELTMSLFLVGYALGALPYGPLANRLGRRGAIFIGTGLAAAASLLLIFAGSQRMFPLFVFGRFLSALGSSVGLKIAYTMIGDVYDQTTATKKLSMAMLSFAIAPGLAIALGGFLTDRFGWESCFYFLSGYSLFILILSLFLPETLKEKNLDALQFKEIKGRYVQTFKNKRVVLGAMIMGCGSAVIYLFATLAPFLGIDLLGLKTEHYGLLNCIPPIGMVVGSMISHRLASRWEPLITMRLGTWLSLLSSLTLLLLFATGHLSAWTLFLPMPFLYAGEALVFTQVSSFVLSHSKDKSTGSSVTHFINLSLCATILFSSQALPSHSVLVMPLLFLLLTATMLRLQSYLKRL